MTNFKRTQLTALGEALAGKAGVDIVFTKVEAGSGIYGDSESVYEAAALKNPVQTVSISDVVRKSDTLINMKFVISNKEIRKSYLLTEVGIYAKDPDAGEILYALCYALPQDSQEVLAYNGEFVSSIIMSVNIQVSGSAVATILQNEGYALQQDLEELRAAVEINMKRYAIGEGIELSVDENGILNVTYDDGEED